MKKNLLLIIASFLALPFATVLHAQSAAAPVAEDAVELPEVSRVISQHFPPKTPGGIGVLITRNGEVIHRQGYGTVKGEPLTPESSLRLASISKQFAAMCAAMLIEEGKLDPQTKVSHYLPDLKLPVKGRELLVQDLLWHISGLPNFMNKKEKASIAEFRKQRGLEFLTNETHAEWLATMSPVREPGKLWEYTNSGYVLLARLIEVIAGEPFHQFQKRRIFDVLGMADTTDSERFNGSGNMATGRFEVRMNRRILCFFFAAWCQALAHADGSTVRDPSFEKLPIGSLDESGRVEQGWEIQKTGRPIIKPRLRADGIEDALRAESGTRCLALTIPEDTVGFEFVTVGQRVQLAAGKEYEAGVWVRWPDGPDTAPMDASATSGKRSAIVSFWARHRDGNGDFAGRDEWLFDNQWHRLTFHFRATEPEQRTLVYVSLLPNQKPAATTVLLDDFELRELDEPTETETRAGRLVLDADFSAQKAGSALPPWYFANMGGKGIRGEMVTEGKDVHFRSAMSKATSNFESAQMWQHVALREGARYKVSCRMRWDNFAPDAPAPIVNFGVYHEATRTWYGPVDQVLEKTGDWRTYRFTHVPPFPGPWKLYVQLNGWGNFGNGVTVSFDDFECERFAR